MAHMYGNPGSKKMKGGKSDKGFVATPAVSLGKKGLKK